MSADPTHLPDYDAGVLARELGLDPEQVTHLAIVANARWIGVRWSGYRRISSDELDKALKAAIAATKAKSRKGSRPASTRRGRAQA